MAGQNSISNFISGFKGGLRKNRFVVNGVLPTSSSTTLSEAQKLKFHVLSTSLPNSTLGIVDFPYRGRKIPYVGDRIYEPWDITVLDDISGGLYARFQAWTELFNKQADNEHQADSDSFSNIISDSWYVYQLRLDGGVEKAIRLRECWPTFVSPLSFQMDSSAFNSFTVRMLYNYIEIQGIEVEPGGGGFSSNPSA